MKINKILAAGTAATLAVTSLAAVAGAESREFDMTKTYGAWNYVAEVSGTDGITLGKDFEVIKDDKGIDIAKSPFASKSITETSADLDTNGDGSKNWNDFDALIPFRVTVSNNSAVLEDYMGDLTVTIYGRGNDNGNLVSLTQKAKLLKVKSVATAAGTLAGVNYVLPIYKTDAPGDAFMPEKFVAVDKVTVEASGIKSIEIDGLSKTVYDAVQKEITDNQKQYLQANDGSVWNAAGNQRAEGGDKYLQISDKSYKAVKAWVYSNAESYTAAKAAVNINLPAGYDPTAAVLYNITAITAGSGTANTEYTVEAVAYADDEDHNKGEERATLLVKEINSLMAKGVTINWKADTGRTYEEIPLLRYTDIYDKEGTLLRDEIWCLSTTQDYNSLTHNGNNNETTVDIANQSYSKTNYNKGDGPVKFAGLASQVADFFNSPNAPRKNALITFHFTAKASSTDTTWKNGGIPSTEVGVKTIISESTVKDFALFLNYGTTTGSLMAITKLDAASGTVSFDISDLLTQLGGQTIGTIQDIYYGLATYATDDWRGKGLWVDKVTLSYDDAAADTAADADIADDDDDDDDDTDVSLDDDDDDDDDDDATLTDDTDDDDDVANAEDINTPADDDANPGTGAALAVIPAIVAAAAAVVSKKRK